MAWYPIENIKIMLEKARTCNVKKGILNFVNPRLSFYTYLNVKVFKKSMY
ncbi:MAG: hypothetical protein ACTSVI_14990 [Promethearchaeota archaeon]